MAIDFLDTSYSILLYSPGFSLGEDRGRGEPQVSGRPTGLEKGEREFADLQSAGSIWAKEDSL